MAQRATRCAQELHDTLFKAILTAELAFESDENGSHHLTAVVVPADRMSEVSKALLRMREVGLV